jgi:hypothetical protein
MVSQSPSHDRAVDGGRHQGSVTAADGEARCVPVAGTSRGSTRISADRGTPASAPICGRRAVVPARSAGVNGNPGHAQAGGERQAGLCVSRVPVHDTPACSRRARPLEIRAHPRLVFFSRGSRRLHQGKVRRKAVRCRARAGARAAASARSRRWRRSAGEHGSKGTWIVFFLHRYAPVLPSSL